MYSKFDFAFLHPFRIRWSECEGQGIVFNADYVAFLDHAIWKWTKALGYKGWDDAPQFVAAHAECDFKGAARFDDDLLIGIRARRGAQNGWAMSPTLRTARQRY